MNSVNLYSDFAQHYNQLMLGGYYDYGAQATSLQTTMPKQARILELGVGTGLLAQELKQRGFHVSGIDHTEEMLVQARELLGPEVLLKQADVTNFDLQQKFDVIISNGGVWYGVYGDTPEAYGFCGHLPTEASVMASLQQTVHHLEPDGKLILSLQDRHADKQMDLPEGVLYTQRITDKGGTKIRVIQKEYIFERDGTRIGYESLDLAYIDNALFEGTLSGFGFQSPRMTSDRRYLVFDRV